MLEILTLTGERGGGKVNTTKVNITSYLCSFVDYFSKSVDRIYFTFSFFLSHYSSPEGKVLLTYKPENLTVKAV